MPVKKLSQIKCGTHGVRVPAVVCRHLVGSVDTVKGFVENSADPQDLQAWCSDCERCFTREGGMTKAFLEFNGMTVVCDFCYASIRERHIAPPALM